MQVEKAATRTLGKREEIEKKNGAGKGAKKKTKNITEKEAERGAEMQSDIETEESSEDVLEDEDEGEGEGESSDDELTATIAADVKTLQRVCRTNHRARLRKLVTRNLAMCTHITSVTAARAQTLVAALPFKAVTMAPEPDASVENEYGQVPKDLLAKSTQNSRYEQEKEDPHRIISLIETDNPRKLPSVGTYITLRDNVSMEDDAALRFLPYFGDNDKTVFDLSVYDSESEEGEVQVATALPIYLHLTIHRTPEPERTQAVTTNLANPFQPRLVE
jgi:hypothetical protein